METISMTVNLLNYSKSALETFFTELGEKPFRARQVMQWIHQQGIVEFDQMLNLSKALREQLKSIATIEFPEIAFDQTSRDGTRKWLLKLACGNHIEMVYIPEHTRGTLCISSQVGCGLNCTFCSTGAQGFNRDLSVAEIISQLMLAKRLLANEDPPRTITNVVMMGMGEPLLNFDNVVAAMDIMMDDLAYGLSKYRVTLSTSGLVPEIKRLSQISKVALAISLHAPNNALRDELVPLNKKYPLEELIKTCKTYFNDRDESKRYVTMEYVMLDGVNDKPEHAKQLAALLQGVRCKINLIPFNPFPMTRYQRSSPERIASFQKQLMIAGYNTIVRKTRGEDINAACGQLAGDFKDRTSRRRRLSQIPIKVETDHAKER